MGSISHPIHSKGAEYSIDDLLFAVHIFESKSFRTVEQSLEMSIEGEDPAIVDTDS